MDARTSPAIGAVPTTSSTLVRLLLPTIAQGALVLRTHASEAMPGNAPELAGRVSSSNAERRCQSDYMSLLADTSRKGLKLAATPMYTTWCIMQTCALLKEE